ncbi:MAG: efflux transporter periplasmic adaptor subunit [Burkholderiales bacterium]|nr:efflux transporter periplasmic adaptor subunit [Burkholderiales bacterium]
MKRIAWVAAATVFAAVAAAAGYWAGMRNVEPPATAATGAGGERKVLYYRNPMGLPDTSPVPKKDPMGMDYVPVYEGEDATRQAQPPGTVRVSADKIQILGVRTEPAAERELRRAVRAVATIQPNERLLYKVSPRFEGWIEKLHVNTTGQRVKRGQPLMDVYSPELVAAQEEYLVALRGMEETRAAGPEAQAVMQRLAESVLRRLRNWGISEAELQAMRQGGKARQLLPYRATVDGVVLAKPSVQGMRFMPGDVLYEIADLSSVWLLAEVFERDLALLRTGQEVKLRTAAYPERMFTGKVVFIYPTLNADTRTARVRIELPNPDGALKPAMYGQVEFDAQDARGKVLAVSDSAVLDSGFEPRPVKLGMRADGYVEVTEGLKAGEEVVVRANFLIDAESNLKAALESFGGGHAGHAAAPAKPAPQVHRGQGTVQAVDAQAGTVEIEHGPIETLKWPAMSMEFKVRDKAQLERLAGEFMIERLAPGGHAGHRG